MGAPKLTYHPQLGVIEKNPSNLLRVLGESKPKSEKRLNYFTFGMQMPGRNENSSDYRYGFQGQEVDNEIKGDGNSINYKYRMHDPRTGRFFAIDPLAVTYPHNSPYAFSENSVVAFIELEGLEKYYAANGSYLGSVGSSQELRIVTNLMNWEFFNMIRDSYSNGTLLTLKDGTTFTADYNHLFKAEQDLIDNTYKAYSEEELFTILINWGNAVKEMEAAKTLENGMVVYGNATTDENGEKIVILLPGRNTSDNDPKSVSLDGSDLRLPNAKAGLQIAYYHDDYGSGWVPYAEIHSHPIGDIGRKFSAADMGGAIESGLPNYVMQFESMTLWEFLPAEYLKLHPDFHIQPKSILGGEYSERSFQREATIEATKTYSPIFHYKGT